MPTNLTLLGVPGNLVDDTSYTLTVTSATTELPVTNLRTASVGEVWRSTGLPVTAYSVRLDLGSTTIPIGGGALCGHNFSTAGTYQHAADNDAGMASTDSTWSAAAGIWPSTEDSTGAAGNLAHLTTGTLYRRYHQFWIRDTANPDGYYQAGRFILSDVRRFTNNFSYGAAFGMDDLSRLQFTPHGKLYADTRPKRRRLSLSQRMLTENEALDRVFQDMYRRKGVTGNFFVIPEPDKSTQYHNQAMYCRLRTLQDITAAPTLLGRFNAGFVLEELL
jgi:hypothetical protein